MRKYLVRLSPDITLKSDRIRARFVTRLIGNLRAACAAAGVKAEIDRQWSRLFVTSADRAVEGCLGRVFGICSWSLIEHECAPDLAEIIRVGGAAYRQAVTGRRFAVRARRTGNHPFSSLEVARDLGAALYPHAAGVDLRHPEVEVHVEVRNSEVYLFSAQARGPGGLPLGVSGRVLCLLSGGFDSAVAAWMLQKRGVETDYLFCNLAGAAYERTVVGLARWLDAEWGHGGRARLHVLDFTPMADEIRRQVKPSHAQVILKRMFYRAATAVADRIGATALLTGECIGQVSSQTLPNLRTIEEVTRLPVLRPVIGWDKEEIMAKARQIGTFSLSAGVQEYCQLVPDRPVTACRPEVAAAQESGIGPEVLDAILAGRKELILKDLTPADLVMPYVQVSEIPPGATVIDCRPREAYELWHWPEARNIEFHELMADPRLLPEGQVYVLYCPIGLQSAVAAEKLQAGGYQAFSFKGGVRALSGLPR